MNKTALIHGEKVAKHAIIHLIVLGCIKTVVGLVTGMTVIMADAISSFADTLSVFASYIGLRLSRKSANKNFEYGYYKVETFMALIISFSIIYLAYEIFMRSLETFSNPSEGQFRYFAIIATMAAIVHSVRLSKKLQDAGRKVNSLSLIASGKDKFMDVFAGFAIIASVLANYQGVPYIEGVISMIISLIILKEGLLTGKESLFYLLDYWNDPILTRKIRKIFREEKDLIVKVKKLRLRRAGTFIFGQAFVEINPFAGIQDLREELDLLQEKIKSLNPYIKDFSIFSHISKSEVVKIAVPIKSGQNLDAKIASTLKETSAYLFANIKKSKVESFYIKKLSKENKKTIEIAEFLKHEKVNILIDNKLSSLVYYNLRRTHHILIYPNFSDIKTAGDTIKLLMIDT
ncbi:cation diffusion facilitator family transporter [Patescibacteria group bacterium]